MDLITLTSYGEHDLSEEPVLVLDCGHLFTLSTLDAHVALAQVLRRGWHSLAVLRTIFARAHMSRLPHTDHVYATLRATGQ